MRIGQLSRSELAGRLARGGLSLATGPVTTRIRTSIPGVAAHLAALYADFPLGEADGIADFSCQLRPPRGVRRYYRPQVLFLADGRSVFKPLAYHQAGPMLEWGMNWCIASQLRDRLIFHAAALERGGRALLLAAPPGSGKSTLCAALACRGWRLLTDEAALVELGAGRVSVAGTARPVSLKNASIEAVQRLAPEAALSAPCRDTLKGTVAHMRPPPESVRRAQEPAAPAWLVFPRFVPGAPTRLTERSRPEAFMGLAANAFNYAALGRRAFHRTADLVERVACYDFRYSRLEEAVQVFDELATRREPSAVPGAGEPGNHGRPHGPGVDGAAAGGAGERAARHPVAPGR